MDFKVENIGDSYSVIGDKSLIFSDTSNYVFSFKDTGGIFGDPKDIKVTKNNFSTQTSFLWLTNWQSVMEKGGPTLIGRLEFNDGYVLYYTDHIDPVLNKWLNCAAQKDFEKFYLPAEISSQDVSRFANFYASLDQSEIDRNQLCRNLTGTNVPQILNQTMDEVLKELHTLPISLCRDKDTVVVNILYVGAQRLPVTALPVIVDDNSVKFSTKILVGDIQLNGFTLHFPTHELATIYVDKLGLHVVNENEINVAQDQVALNGLISRAKINGYIDGEEIKFSEYDVELELTSLNIFSPGTTSRIASFNFADPLLSLDGTTDSFLISNKPDTVVRIAPESNAFHKAILSNKLVRSAAHLSANKGPYIATMQSGGLVYVGIGDNVMQLTSGNNVKNIPITDVSVGLTWDGDAPYLMTPLGGLIAQLPMLEGIASAVSAIQVKPSVQNHFKNSISRMLGVEGEYFTHSVFGQLAETHLGIADAVGASPLDEMSSMHSEQDQTTFLVFMMQNVVPISQHIETTLNYLPSFASSMDNRFLEGAGLREHLNVKNNELAYQRALQPVASLLSHLYKIDGAVSKLVSLRKQLIAQEQGWGKFLPLGISAAASLINPFALVATAQQGLSLMNKGGAQANLEKDTHADVFAICVKEWDYLIHTLLPAVAYRVTQEIYPIRLNLSGLLLGANEKADGAAKEKLVNAVAGRYSYVETFKSFSNSSVNNVPRERSINFMFELQKHAESFQFRHF